MLINCIRLSIDRFFRAYKFGRHETEIRIKKHAKGLPNLYIISNIVIIIHTVTLSCWGSQTNNHSKTYQGLSANPAALGQPLGTGEINNILGIKDSTGVQLGGLWIGDADGLISGGAEPGRWSWQSLLIVGAILDAEKLLGWKGSSFGAQFLRYDGQPTNEQAGSLMGYDNLECTKPLHRSELYQLWWKQCLFDNRFIFRIGKMSPTDDFTNVGRLIPTKDPSLLIPAVSFLNYTPMFVNPTMLGMCPGYYNSAYGLTCTLAPTKNVYFSYGLYDGNLARGEETGLEGPHFNGYYLHMWELGTAWELADKLPGALGVGFWYQTGHLTAPGASQNGCTGFYLFGSQRLWSEHPGIDNSGLVGFAQYGENDGKTLLFHQFFALGLTGLGLVPMRPKDSLGIGMTWGWINPTFSNRSSELMFQAYYQINILKGVSFEPLITYIPTPGADSSLRSAWAITLQSSVLF